MSTVTEPGIYADISHEDYVADPVKGGSISSTGLKMMLQEGGPAKFKHYRDNGRVATRSMEFGSLAHMILLGEGPEITVVHKVTRDKSRVPADDYATKSAQEHAAEIRAAGAIPVLEHEVKVARAMADAVRRHDVAHSLLTQPGKAEQSGFWQDAETGVWVRVRYDYLPDVGDGRLIIPDYKTCTDSAPSVFNRTVVDKYGYHQQAALYVEAARVLLDQPDAAFVWIAQEKAAPYLPSVIEVNPEWLRIGREMNRHAIRRYAECVATDTWPGHEGVTSPEPPPWVITQHEDRMYRITEATEAAA